MICLNYEILSGNPNITWEIILANPDKPWRYKWVSSNLMKKQFKRYMENRKKKYLNVVSIILKYTILNDDVVSRILDKI